MQRRLHLRYDGSDSTLEIPFTQPREMARAFAAAHVARFGFAMPDRALIAETAAVAHFLVQTEAVHRAAAASEGVVEEVPHNLPVVAAAVVETKKVEHEILGGALRQRRALPIRREGGAHERLGLG